MCTKSCEQQQRICWLPIDGADNMFSIKLDELHKIGISLGFEYGVLPLAVTIIIIVVLFVPENVCLFVYCFCLLYVIGVIELFGNLFFISQISHKVATNRLSKINYICFEITLLIGYWRSKSYYIGVSYLLFLLLLFLLFRFYIYFRI